MNQTDRWKSYSATAKAYTVAFLRWLILGIIVGILCGLVGTAFAKSVSYVTELRGAHRWLLFLLPIGGLVSVAVYQLCRVTDVGTNQVFESVRSEKHVSVLLAPAVFIGSVLTHLGGGSAGREGAALQLGGSISALLGQILHLDEKARHILTMCGMGALFSAIFGTPLGACVFALEVVSVGQFCSAAFFPVLISSVTAYSVADLLGVPAERFPLSAVPEMSVSVLWRLALIAIVCALVSVVFCHTMHFAGKLFPKLISNPYLRIFVGGVMIVLLTLIFGTDYNGGGIDVIERIFVEGDVHYEAFLLKIIFTAITISAGFKGGEIIPTLFIGATLGGSLAVLIGLDPAFGAALGMAALFCGVTNCPLATIFLCIEMFGVQGAVFFALSAAASFLLSGYASLYTGQKILFSKLQEEFIDLDAG